MDGVFKLDRTGLALIMPRTFTDSLLPMRDTYLNESRKGGTGAVDIRDFDTALEQEVRPNKLGHG
jgi:hypothetical protein